MTLRPGLRKLALTLHVAVSVGFGGAVACFLSLAVVGAIGHDIELARSSYRAMQLITWIVIVPLALVSILSGIFSSLGTNWGLIRYYWVALKLVATVFATLILLVHTNPIDELSYRAQVGGGFDGLQGQQWMMVAASALALVVLIVLTALSVYKPQGLTPYGIRNQTRQRAETSGDLPK